MPLTADEVAATTFTEARRGFDPAEVEYFRTTAVQTLEEYEAQRERLDARLAAVKVRAAELAETQEAVQRTLAAAIRTKDEMVTEATAESERMRSDAAEETSSLREETLAHVKKVRAEGSALAQSILEEGRSRAARIRDEAASAADRAASENEAELDRLQRSLRRLEAAMGEIEDRFRVFATGALDEVGVVSAAIDHSADELAGLEPFQSPEDAGERYAEAV